MKDVKARLQKLKKQGNPDLAERHRDSKKYESLFSSFPTGRPETHINFKGLTTSVYDNDGVCYGSHQDIAVEDYLQSDDCCLLLEDAEEIF